MTAKGRSRPEHAVQNPTTSLGRRRALADLGGGIQAWGYRGQCLTALRREHKPDLQARPAVPRDVEGAIGRRIAGSAYTWVTQSLAEMDTLMSRADFDALLKRQAAEKSQPDGFDPNKQLEQWQSYLSELYTDIGGYLGEYVTSGKASIVMEDITLNEDFSGPYTVQQMNLRIAGSMVIFEPIGTMLIGSKGRVDVQGPRGSARLSLINRKTTNVRQMIRVRVRIGNEPEPSPEPDQGPIEWVWKIIKATPDVDFIDLTEDSFFDLIIGVIDAEA